MMDRPIIPPEIHGRGYRFAGPYTDTDARLSLNHIENLGAMPVDMADFYAFQHDILYWSPNPKIRRDADRRMREQLRSIESKTFTQGAMNMFMDFILTATDPAQLVAAPIDADDPEANRVAAAANRVFDDFAEYMKKIAVISGGDIILKPPREVGPEAGKYYQRFYDEYKRFRETMREIYPDDSALAAPIPELNRRNLVFAAAPARFAEPSAQAAPQIIGPHPGPQAPPEKAEPVAAVNALREEMAKLVQSNTVSARMKEAIDQVFAIDKGKTLKYETKEFMKLNPEVRFNMVGIGKKTGNVAMATKWKEVAEARRAAAGQPSQADIDIRAARLREAKTPPEELDRKEAEEAQKDREKGISMGNLRPVPSSGQNLVTTGDVEYWVEALKWRIGRGDITRDFVDSFVSMTKSQRLSLIRAANSALPKRYRVVIPKDIFNREIPPGEWEALSVWKRAAAETYQPNIELAVGQFRSAIATGNIPRALEKTLRNMLPLPFRQFAEAINSLPVPDGFKLPQDQFEAALGEDSKKTQEHTIDRWVGLIEHSDIKGDVTPISEKVSEAQESFRHAAGVDPGAATKLRADLSALSEDDLVGFIRDNRAAGAIHISDQNLAELPREEKVEVVLAAAELQNTPAWIAGTIVDMMLRDGELPRAFIRHELLTLSDEQFGETMRHVNDYMAGEGAPFPIPRNIDERRHVIEEMNRVAARYGIEQIESKEPRDESKADPGESAPPGIISRPAQAPPRRANSDARPIGIDDRPEYEAKYGPPPGRPLSRDDLFKRMEKKLLEQANKLRAKRVGMLRPMFRNETQADVDRMLKRTPEQQLLDMSNWVLFDVPDGITEQGSARTNPLITRDATKTDATLLERVGVLDTLEAYRTIPDILGAKPMWYDEHKRHLRSDFTRGARKAKLTAEEADFLAAIKHGSNGFFPADCSRAERNKWQDATPMPGRFFMGPTYPAAVATNNNTLSYDLFKRNPLLFVEP